MIFNDPIGGQFDRDFFYFAATRIEEDMHLQKNGSALAPPLRDINFHFCNKRKRQQEQCR
jgi:hypothetical protein